MSKNSFVQLNRTFRELGEKEISSDNLHFEQEWDLWGGSRQTGWKDLEKRYRTVILAEGGAGKTREMEERCSSLREDGKSAWFLELEMLADESVEELLNQENQLTHFVEWKKSHSDDGWFFLDAVDELKLKTGDFRKALHRLKQSIATVHDRARILISCRPSDWGMTDIRYFEDFLPAPEIFEDDSSSGSSDSLGDSSEERFLAPLRGRPGRNVDDETDKSVEGMAAHQEELKIYQLRRLTRSQIRKFSEAVAVDIAEKFVETIDIHDRWSFARQPQDLLELLALWREQESLGTLKEQHEAFLLSSLREREGRPEDSGSLTPQKARQGAERLALALALSKKRTLINITDNVPVGITPASVCPRELLKDWKSQEIKALLRLRVFDPPSYGRVKFHRRDVEEYLAAARFTNLAAAGNDSGKRLLELLFSKRMVLPTMKSIAVWVALFPGEFGKQVRILLLKIEPGILLERGDLEHLPLADKVLLVEKFAAKYTDPNFGFGSYSRAALRRFSEPGLEQVIIKHFGTGQIPDKAGNLLLGLINEGRLVGCEDILAMVASSPRFSEEWRAQAVRGLIACELDSRLEEVVRDIIESPQRWSADLLASFIGELVPRPLSIRQLAEVLEVVTSDGEAISSEIAQSVQQAAERLDDPAATDLKCELVKGILGSQLPKSTHYRAISRWSELTPALATLCLNLRNHAAGALDRENLFACLTAIWFCPEKYYRTDLTKDLIRQTTECGLPRKQRYQWELEYALENFPAEQNQLIVVHRSLVAGLTVEDSGWLEELVKSQKPDVRVRLSALLERVQIWNGQDRPSSEKVALQNLAGESEIINERLDGYLAPLEVSKHKIEGERFKREQESKEKKRLEGWLEWRRGILPDPVQSFSGDNLRRNRHVMLEWLMADSRKNGSYLVWGSGTGIVQAFSNKTRDAAATAFRGCWRSEDVKTFSEQDDDRSNTLYSWIYALTGVAVELENDGWETRFSDDEVRQASRIAMVEINGLADYIEHLIRQRPDPVKEVLSIELAAQWAMRSRFQNLPLLQNLASGSPTLKGLLRDEVVKLLLGWTKPPEMSDEALRFVKHHLSQLVRTLLSCWEEVSGDERNSLKTLCDKTLRDHPESIFSSDWLRLLFLIDSDHAVELLDETIKAHAEGDRKNVAVGLYAALFSDRFERVSLGELDERRGPRLLSRLVELAYTYVMPSEDVQRPSGACYTPTARDDAERARTMLVNQLIDTEGIDADREIDRLAKSPPCSTIQGYLEDRKRIRVQNRADRSYSVPEISEIEVNFETKPRDRDSLFRVMMARLKDLQDFIDNDDFVPLLTLQRITSEEEMQLTLAMLLKHSSNGIYEVSREPEVRGRKRTDIQLCVPDSKVKSVIEIKVGEKQAWTVSALLGALEDQLVNQYLLQNNRKAGCFLITYGGHNSECSKCGYILKPRKKWKDPDSGKFLDFVELIARLNVRAKEIVDEHNGEISLEVFGLDLRGPA